MLVKKTLLDEFNRWLSHPETEHLEFKKASSDFNRGKDLPDYRAALANEGGGKLVLGVDPEGKVTGTKAFSGTYQTLPHELLNKLHVRVKIEEIDHPDGRVLVFHVMGRPVGSVIQSTGKYKYPMRAGESLLEMNPETLKRIFNEVDTDFSAKKVPGMTLADIDESSVENVLEKSVWRNRLIAEIFEKAGMVERSGQGMDDIFRMTIEEGKGLPEFSGTDDFGVTISIPAQIKDPQFILFIEKVIKEKHIGFSFEEIYELERIRQKQPVRSPAFKDRFLEYGIIEKTGSTKGARYILSQGYYIFKGKTGIHTKLSGIPRGKYKELILKHLEKKKGYIRDLKDATELKPKEVTNLLQELRREDKVQHHGPRKSGYWTLKAKNGKE
jgi:predicted HTH transcriptional regulator